MISVKDAYIEVDKSSTSTPSDFTIPWDDIESVQYARRLNRLKDEGSIVLNNDDGTYSTGDREITLGDRLDVYVTPQQAPSTWGEDYSIWGYGGWGGELLVWSAQVVTPTYVRSGPTSSTLTLDCTDYVYGVLSDRIVFEHFEDTKIAGSSDAILDTVLGRETPELETERIGDVSDTTTIVADGTNLLEFVIKLARRASAVMWATRNYLVFDKPENLATEFTIDASADIGTVEHPFDGGSVRNQIRVDGGSDHAIDDEQTTQDGYVTVTESSRESFQVSTRKSELERLELWTRTTGSQESISVRLQKDDGGAPIAPGDSDSDIASKQLSHEFLASDSLTTFLMPGHTLPEPNPWVIVETDGPNGQDIGVDTATGTPAYKAHYPFPITAQVRARDSIARYGRKEWRLKQDNLTSLDAAREVALEAREHYREPESEVVFPAESVRAHRLDPGEIVAMDPALSRERIEGDYIVSEIEDTMSGNTLHTTIKAQDVEAI